MDISFIVIVGTLIAIVGYAVYDSTKPGSGVRARNEKGHYINKGLKKITHSFGKKLEGVENRSLSEVEELLFGFSIEKMAEKEFPLIDESFDTTGEENLQLLGHRYHI